MLNSKLLYRSLYTLFLILSNWVNTQLRLLIRLSFWKIRISRSKTSSDLLIAVSLTSYPKRYKFLKKTLQTLITQKIRPNAIFVNIYEPELAMLSRSLRRLSRFGVVYQSCDVDLKSYLKLVPVSGMNGFDVFITVDDDIYYSRNFVSLLLNKSRSKPSHIIGYRGYFADTTNEDVHFWKPILDQRESNSDIFLTGVGGILYPSKHLSRMATYFNEILSLAPSADDLGFFFVENELHIDRMTVYSECSRPRYWPGSQSLALWRSNVQAGGNSIALRSLKKHFYSA